MATTGGRENFVQKVSRRKSKVEVILAIKKTPNHTAKAESFLLFKKRNTECTTSEFQISCFKKFNHFNVQIFTSLIVARFNKIQTRLPNIYSG